MENTRLVNYVNMERQDFKMKCFYHNDPDGWCSAFWVRKYCEKQGIPFTREDFIEVNYDSGWLVDKVEQGETVFMVDFSVEPEQMILFTTNTDFIWIDHHISAIEKMEKYKGAYEFKGIRDTNYAACALTWLYFNWDLDYSYCEYDFPEFTRLIYLWDSWEWKKLDEFDQVEVEAFIVGLQARDTHPCSVEWDRLNDPVKEEKLTRGKIHVLSIVSSGQDMLAFRDGYAKSLCSTIGKVVDFEGYKCFACNIPKPNSEWFKSVDASLYDIMMPFYYNMNTEQFIVSLYTTNPDINVAKIAEKHGGGGHNGAAGFQCKDLPWRT